MSFSYGAGSNQSIDYVRLLCADTVDLNHIFEDSEILAAQTINQLQFSSGQFYSGSAGSNFPLTPRNYLRAAALLLNALAADKSRLASIKQLLDVRLDSSDAADQLRQTAQMYLDMDDNSGAIFIAEQVTTGWAFRDRFWSQVQRQSGGSIG